MKTHPFLRQGYAVVDVENSGLLDGLNPTNPNQGPNAIVVGHFSPEGEMTSFTGCVAEDGVAYAVSDENPNATWFRANVKPKLEGLEHVKTRSAMRQSIYTGAIRPLLDAGMPVFVDCGWPVEAIAFFEMHKEWVAAGDFTRTFQGPFPLHEIASFVAGCGYQPLLLKEGKPDFSYRFVASGIDQKGLHDPREDVRASGKFLWLAATGQLDAKYRM